MDYSLVRHVHPHCHVLAQGRGRRYASFTSVEQPPEHIDVFIAAYNETASPFAWTKKKVHQRQKPPYHPAVIPGTSPPTTRWGKNAAIDRWGENAGDAFRSVRGSPIDAAAQRAPKPTLDGQHDLPAQGGKVCRRARPQ